MNAALYHVKQAREVLEHIVDTRQKHYVNVPSDAWSEDTRERYRQHTDDIIQFQARLNVLVRDMNDHINKWSEPPAFKPLES